MRRAGVLGAISASPLVLVVLVALLASACTVFSGWSDLQDGDPSTGDAGAPKIDGATRDGQSSSADARADGSSGTPFGQGVRCGATRCAQDEGCCKLFGSDTRSCTDSTTCANAQGVFLECTSRDSCSLTGLDCCLGSDMPLHSTCTAACPEQGKVMLCDPSEAMPCSSGTCNMTGPGNFGLMYCGQ